MTVTVADLLKKSQQELDDLFKQAPPGDIPNGEAKGTAIIAPGTPFSDEIAQTMLLLPTLSLVAESDLVVGAHTSSAVHEVTERVRRLLAVARGGEPEGSAVRRGLVSMPDDL